MIPKKILKIISSVALVFTLMGNVTYAYSLDNVKQDYKKIKIKKHSGVTDAGYKVDWREGKIMKLYTPTNGNLTILEFYLYEFPNDKYVEIKLSHTNPSWALWDRLTLGDGKRAYDIFPIEKPRRGLNNGWTVEILKFRIRNRNDFYKLKNAIQVRAKGKNYYTDFVIKKDEYSSVMNVIERFLFE